jgi:hypothetical protein
MKRRVFFSTAAFAAVTARAQTLVRPSEVLYVHGSAMAAGHVLTPEDLAKQPAETVGTFVQSRGTPGQETRSAVRGARIAPLVERLGLKPAARSDWKNLLVTVTATDGYRAHFTWTELVNSPVGEGALLVFERDGQPLDLREGRIAVYSGADFRLGARHVRNAVRLEVRPID